MTAERSPTLMEEFDIPVPDVSQLITEDDSPVDNILSERQMHLLPDALYASWKGPGDGRNFVALADVGIFVTTSHPPLVPDVLVALDVQLPENFMKKDQRSYFFWLYGKPPDVVIEVVSNREGGELGHKLQGYARLGVPYY
ncbi:MAG: Uma2 family endonuclease, partial [Caldilineaceae bacterium]|nr:Uma2 family endonuclease [Caldilineaceae bacterium]